MTQTLRRTLRNATIFGAVGITMEVLFTALSDYRSHRDKRLPGYSYAWMLPIYGATPVALERLYPRLKSFSTATRLGVYVPLIMAAEYASGWALRRATGACPWEHNYRQARWNVDGLVRLDYVPAWAVATWLFEALHKELAQTHLSNSINSTERRAA